jgi:hypothetical protein
MMLNMSRRLTPGAPDSGCFLSAIVNPLKPLR